MINTGAILLLYASIQYFISTFYQIVKTSWFYTGNTMMWCSPCVFLFFFFYQGICTSSDFICKIMIFFFAMFLSELYKQVWLQLNTVLPRCLWVMSINALLHEKSAVKNVFLTQENIVLDPLQVLRCDTRVFRWDLFIYLFCFALLAQCLIQRTCPNLYLSNFMSVRQFEHDTNSTCVHFKSEMN